MKGGGPGGGEIHVSISLALSESLFCPFSAAGFVFDLPSSVIIDSALALPSVISRPIKLLFTQSVFHSTATVLFSKFNLRSGEVEFPMPTTIQWSQIEPQSLDYSIAIDLKHVQKLTTIAASIPDASACFDKI